MKKNTYKAIGLMSGTSCDGIDMVYCSFHFDKQWSYKILTAKMVDYSPEWIRKLRNAIHLSEEELTQFDRELGTYFGKETKQFIEENNLTEIDFIASHGHTVFHKPEKGITVQIGSGKAIKEATQISVINDFRSLDVANGGQGAPLVPVGDKLLFSQYDYCLNIGGIANVSYEENGTRKAYDVCFANMILNPLANELGLPFDRDGEIAKRGNLTTQLLNELMNLDFENNSLGYEIYEKYILPILGKYSISNEDKITAVTHYLALSITKLFSHHSSVLITGGGAFNTFLISLIKQNTSANLVQANKELIEYKEALIFAFLGVLKLENTPNCLSSVTGARKDVVGGVIV